jgi:hypothetical protein
LNLATRFLFIYLCKGKCETCVRRRFTKFVIYIQQIVCWARFRKWEVVDIYIYARVKFNLKKYYMNVVNLTRSENPLPQRSSSTQLEVHVQRVKFHIFILYECSGSHKVWKSITTTEFIHPIGGGWVQGWNLKFYPIYECSGSHKFWKSITTTEFIHPSVKETR